MSASDGELTSKVEATMARVRARVPSSAGNAAASRSSGGFNRYRAGEAYLFPEDLYRNLHQARTIGGGISVDYQLGWRTPIIGHAWRVVRQRIHQEIRIYIDSLTTQQSNLNTHLIRAVTAVVETLDGLGMPAMKRHQDEQAELIAALEDEVRTLRSQIEVLQARLDGPHPPAAG